MPDRPPGLDDPHQAAHAWRRYRRLMAWMTLAAAVCAGLAVAGLEHVYGPLTIVGIVATIVGIGGSILLAAALMGLVFLSSGTGHDEAVGDRG